MHNQSIRCHAVAFIGRAVSRNANRECLSRKRGNAVHFRQRPPALPFFFVLFSSFHSRLFSLVATRCVVFDLFQSQIVTPSMPSPRLPRTANRNVENRNRDTGSTLTEHSRERRSSADAFRRRTKTKDERETRASYFGSHLHKLRFLFLEPTRRSVRARSSEMKRACPFAEFLVLSLSLSLSLSLCCVPKLICIRMFAFDSKRMAHFIQDAASNESRPPLFIKRRSLLLRVLA